MADKYVTSKSLSDDGPPDLPPGKLSDTKWDEWEDVEPLAEELDPAPDGVTYELISSVRTYHVKNATVASARELIERVAMGNETIKDCNVYPGGLIQVITTETN